MERQEQKSEAAKTSSDDQEVKPNPHVIETGKKLQEDIDHLVDEIDEVLEEKRCRVRQELRAERGRVTPLSSLFLPPSILSFFVSSGQCGWAIGEIRSSRQAFPFDTLRISSYDRCCSRFLRHTWISAYDDALTKLAGAFGRAEAG